VVGTLAVDGWTVTFGTAMRGLGGLRAASVPTTDFILFGVAPLHSKGLICCRHSSQSLTILGECRWTQFILIPGAIMLLTPFDGGSVC